MEISGSTASAQYLAASRAQIGQQQTQQSQEIEARAQEQGESVERPETERISASSSGQRIDTYA